MESIRQVKCPSCGATVAWTESSRFRPFCSARCRSIDLGDWAAERHRIAGEPLDPAADAPDPQQTSPAGGGGAELTPVVARNGATRPPGHPRRRG
jgi:endogenous inhibitor of DNA gyrase (YacG/DUF329 family)